MEKREEVKFANADGVVSVTVKRICIDLLRSRSAHPEQAIDDDLTERPIIRKKV